METGFHDSSSRLQWICLFLDCNCNCQSHRSTQVYNIYPAKMQLPWISRSCSEWFIQYFCSLYALLSTVPLSCSFSQTFSKIITFLLLFPSIVIFPQFFPSIASLRLPFLSWRSRWKKKWGRITAWDNRNCMYACVSVCVCTCVSHVIAPFFLESHTCIKSAGISHIENYKKI